MATIRCFSAQPDETFLYENLGSEECHASQEMIKYFSQNGFLIVRKLFSGKEIEKVNQAINQSQDFKKASFGLSDTEKLKYYQSHWATPGKDILGLMVLWVRGGQRSSDSETVTSSPPAKLANQSQLAITCGRRLLDRGEIYLYSGKVIMKQEHTGGALVWHQDYGYWYGNRALFPDFISCFVALTKNDRENGGLEVLKGSHLCGRLDHGPKAGQQGADIERVQLIEKVLPHAYCDLAPGDAIFFHANTLHKSDINRSEFKRWNIIFSYCSKANSPDLPHYNAIYTGPLQKVSSDAVEKCENLELETRNYSDPKTNKHLDTDF